MGYKKGSVEVVKEDVASEEMISMLEKTVLGNESGLRYQHLRTRERISQISTFFFLQIKRHGKILGTVGVVKREVHHKRNKALSYYVRFLSMKNFFGKFNQPKPTHSKKKTTFIDEALNKLLDSIQGESDSITEKISFYAYVEKDNLASQNMCLRNGFKKSGEISTHLFGRINPKSQAQVTKVIDKDFYLTEVSEFYTKHHFKFFDDLFKVGNVYEIRVENQIVAGLRAIKSGWRIMNIPGMVGLILMKILPNLSILKKVINPEKFEFLGFDSIWFKPGFENQIEIIMEHALSENNFNVGMYWVDINDELKKKLQENVRTGLIGKLKNDISADVLVREKQKQNKKYLHYVNALDMI